MFKKIIEIFKSIWKKIVAFFRWYRNLYKGRRWYTKTALGFATAIVSLLLYLGLVDMNFLWLFGKSPGFSEISHPNKYEASLIYSADGKIIGKFYNENRIPVKYSEIAPSFFDALIDTEDERFYNHYGIDFQGLVSAAKDAATGNARGASTITQQLAKNMFRVRTNYSTGLLGNIPGISKLIMKSKEWIIATKLEIIYNKREILTMYANTVDFGANSFGLKTASRTYYNTTPDSLTVDQAAVLVGMLKGPTLYSPLLHPEKSQARRNTVLNNMRLHGHLSKEDYTHYSQKETPLHFTQENLANGVAPYFRDEIVRELHDWCENGGYDLETSGLKIYTTLDSKLQEYAEQAVKEQMRQVQKNFDEHWRGRVPWVDENGDSIKGFIEGIAKRLPVYEVLKEKYKGDDEKIFSHLNSDVHKVRLFDYEQGHIEKDMSTMDSIRYMVSFMHCGFMAMEPQTGFVKAWVGDVDYQTWQYDKVTADRQAGSTFKLFVYTEAINQGMEPCDTRRDEAIAMEVYDSIKREYVTWRPQNADGKFTGDSIPLRSAFARSINSIAVGLGRDMGIKNVIRTARNLGLTTNLEDQPSLALGASDVRLKEMIGAYAAVADGGKLHHVNLVIKILDSDGNEVYTADEETTQAMPYKTAYLMQKMLRAGTTEGGGTSLALNSYTGNAYDTEYGGKTGTTNNHSDAWFIAVSPKLVCGAWVGGEYRCIHFRTGALGQGSKTALPVCGRFLQLMLADPQYMRYHGKFPPAEDGDISQAMWDCNYIPHKEEADSLDMDSLYFDEPFDDELPDNIPLPNGESPSAGNSGNLDASDF